MTIPQLIPEVSLMVHDSFQFNLDEKFTPEMIQQFLDECERTRSSRRALWTQDQRKKFRQLGIRSGRRASAQDGQDAVACLRRAIAADVGRRRF